MYDFPASVRQPTDYATIIVNVALLALLALMIWFAVRRPRPNAAGIVRVWPVLSIGVWCAQLLGVIWFPTHALTANLYGAAAIIICIIGGVRESLRTERAVGLKPA